jgi:hypothetical protein
MLTAGLYSNARRQTPLEAAARHERRLAAVACRVEPMVAHPAPHRPVRKSLSCVCPWNALPDGAFPLVGRLGLTSPPSPVLCAATTATLPVLGRFACRSPPRYLTCFHGSWCPYRARGRVEAPRPRQGFWSPGPHSGYETRRPRACCGKKSALKRPLCPCHSGADSRNCSRSTRLSAFPVGVRGMASVKCTRLGNL